MKEELEGNLLTITSEGSSLILNDRAEVIYEITGEISKTRVIYQQFLAFTAEAKRAMVKTGMNPNDFCEEKSLLYSDLTDCCLQTSLGFPCRDDFFAEALSISPMPELGPSLPVNLYPSQKETDREIRESLEKAIQVSRQEAENWAELLHRKIKGMRSASWRKAGLEIKDEMLVLERPEAETAEDYYDDYEGVVTLPVDNTVRTEVTIVWELE